MSNRITEKTCTGCGACVLSCPHGAISFKENRLGFFTPFIEDNKCIQCNKCKKICPLNTPVVFHYPQKCYAAWSREEENWIISSSGGVGAVIADFAIDNSILIYGCDYDSDGELLHFCANDRKTAKKFRSSKYSRSNSIEAFAEIIQNLKEGRKVIYIGTPCQTAAIIRLTGNPVNLFTVDLVCHGTPPNKYLKEYINEICGLPVDKIRFRGEYDQKLSVWRENKIIYQKEKSDDLYFKAFYDNMISYESCYTCVYAKAERCSDMTIADFWGLGQLKTIEKKSERPSLVLINTEKGNSIFEQIKGNLYCEEREVIEGIRGNGRLIGPPQKNFKAKIFEKYYPQKGFVNAVKISHHKDDVQKQKAKKREALKQRIKNSPINQLAHRVYRKIKRTILGVNK